ncbi:SRPBCC domain-containing protein [Nannocystaceae bacterium ST9]
MTATRVHEVFIRTSPERLWAAITDPDQTEQYLFGSRVHSSWKAGDPIVYTAGAEGPTMVEGTIVEIVPQQALQQTWVIQYDPALAGECSRVGYRLEPRGENVKLTVSHDFTGAPESAAHLERDGWSVVLSSMKSLLETGRALALPTA